MSDTADQIARLIVDDIRNNRAAEAIDCGLTSEEWNDIKERHGHRCEYCRRKMTHLTQDHVIPISKGGTHTKENVVPACQSCNSRKGAKIVTLF